MWDSAVGQLERVGPRLDGEENRELGAGHSLRRPLVQEVVQLLSGRRIALEAELAVDGEERARQDQAA
jgi:hypothetical protein